MTKDEQTEFEGMEQQRIKAIETVADKYTEKRVLWQGIGDELATLKAKVMEVMHANVDKIGTSGDGVLVYKCGDYNVTISTNEKLKVKIAGKDGEEED